MWGILQILDRSGENDKKALFLLSNLDQIDVLLLMNNLVFSFFNLEFAVSQNMPAFLFGIMRPL
ncbi:hypothetical protein DQY66_22210 [Salmonella enterica subsp. enterica serovar Utah]|nr:hypothetical protein [Salmonella enterica subsp. enterica serovar Utah]